MSAAAAINTRALLVALLLLAAGLALSAYHSGGRMALLFVLGGCLGVTLYHAAFGFTSAWRRFLASGDGRGIRAQLFMLALAVLLFFPALEAGELFGRPVGGFVFPVGTSLLVGAFLFGVGMQLGGGCGSGTLFTVGGGSTRMVITLGFFVIGSVVATAHLPWWFSLPGLAPVSFVQRFGAVQAILLNLTIFAALAWVTLVIQRRARFEPLPTDSGSAASWLRGPWPLLAGAAVLAILNFATLALAGRPWGITSAFALWGAKVFNAAGVDMASWPYWQGNMAAIEGSVWRDVTSVMDFGLVIGAFAAASLAGRFAPVWRLGRGEIASAVIGGLLLGYGARLAWGCNIGAFFSGIASGSLHGWIWLVMALAGNRLGIAIRPFFGLSRG